MNYWISVHQNGHRLCGSDYNRFVKDCKSNVKLNNAIKLLRASTEGLKTIKPYLNKGYTIETERA